LRGGAGFVRGMALSSDQEENRHMNVSAALCVIATYTVVPSLSNLCCASDDFVVTLSRCLDYGSPAVRTDALTVIRNVASSLQLQKSPHLVQSLNALVDPPASPSPSLLSATFKAVANLAQLPANGDVLSTSLSDSYFGLATTHLLKDIALGSKSDAFHPTQDAAINLILALSRSCHSLKRRVASSDAVVGACVAVACCSEVQGALRGASGRALRAMTVPDSPRFTDSVLAREAMIVSSCLEASLGGGNPDIVTDLGHLLTHVTSLKEREARRARMEQHAAA